MASLSEQIAIVQTTFGLSDKQLADTFDRDLVTGEIIAQWRNRNGDKRLPRMGDIYQLKVVYRLAASFQESGLGEEWLHSPGGNGLTPFEQICDGRMLRVQAGIDATVSQAKSATTPRLG